MIRKLYYLHGLLFLAAVVFVGLILTRENTLPARPDVQRMVDAGQVGDKPDAQDNQPTETYPNLGRAPVFDTIYPRPTPVPSPVPTQKPDPRIEQFTSSWKLSAIIPGGQAMFEDAKTNEDWMMSIGDTKVVRFSGANLDVLLESTNESEFSATISFTGQQGKQTRVLNMFD